MPENNLVSLPKPPSNATEEIKNRLWCHRFMIPLPLMEQSEVSNPLNPSQKIVQIQPKPQMSFIKCLKAECSLWNEKHGMCSDKLQAESLAGILDHFVMLEGQIKIIGGEGG